MTNIRIPISTWCCLVVEQIGAGSESAVEDLYKSLRSILFFFIHQIGPDRAEDAYHDLIIDLVGAIKTDALRQPEALFAYAMKIARRAVIRHIREAIRERQTLDVEHIVLTCNASESPEQLVLRSEKLAIAEQVLAALPPRKREILIRSYLNGESEEEIRAAMGMSHNQFRLIKSRAKSRYAEHVQQSMNRLPNRKPVQSASGGAPLTASNSVMGKTKAGVTL